MPVVTPGVIADIFKIPVPVAFRAVAWLVITLFYFFTWYFLSRKVTNIVALTGLWICYTIHSYPITWNLFNVYQVTDSVTYLWTVLIVISFVNRNLFLFIPISFLSIITKQNLWFLVLPGYMFFLLHYFRTKENKKLILTLFFGAIISSAVLLMFFTEAGSIKKYISSTGLDKIFNISTYRGRGFSVFKNFAWIYLPILPVIFIKYKIVCKKTLEYFPLIPFFIVSFLVVWPISLFESSMDAYPRIMQPVVWPLCAYISVLIVNDFDKLKNKYLLWVLYLARILFGVTHLAFYTISFKPLFMFPSTFRHFLILFLILVYFFIWHQRKVQKIQ